MQYRHAKTPKATYSIILILQWLMLLLCPPLILMADEVRKQIVHRIGDRMVQAGDGKLSAD
jgi:hypothetical protein